MATIPADLKADFPIIRCARARRGGQPCRGVRCVCLDPENLLRRADALLARILRTADLSPHDRAAAEDWRRAFEQDKRERAAADGLPLDLREAIQTIIEPPGLGTAALTDLERLKRRLRGTGDRPVSRALLVQALSWVRRNLCPPRGQVAR